MKFRIICHLKTPLFCLVMKKFFTEIKVVCSRNKYFHAWYLIKPSVFKGFLIISNRYYLCIMKLGSIISLNIRTSFYYVRIEGVQMQHKQFLPVRSATWRSYAEILQFNRLLTTKCTCNGFQSIASKLLPNFYSF